jgi:hypothetical protein
MSLLGWPSSEWSAALVSTGNVVGGLAGLWAFYHSVVRPCFGSPAKEQTVLLGHAFSKRYI